MKKGFRGTGTVERVDFPNKGIAVTDDGDRVIVKNTIPGQKVEFVVNKVKHQILGSVTIFSYICSRIHKECGK